MPPNLPYGYVYADAPPSQPQMVPSRMSEARADPLFESPDTDSDSEDQSSIAPMKKAKTAPPQEPKGSGGLFSTTKNTRRSKSKDADKKDNKDDNTATAQDTCPKGARPKSTGKKKAPAMPFGVNGITIVPTQKNETSELQERFDALKRKIPLVQQSTNSMPVELDSEPEERVHRASTKARSSSASGLTVKGTVAEEVRGRSMSARPMRPEADGKKKPMKTTRRAPSSRTREIKIYTSGEERLREHKLQLGMERGYVVHIPCFEFHDPSTRCYCCHPGEHELILQGIVHDKKFGHWLKDAKAQVMDSVERGQHHEPSFAIIVICQKGRHR